MIYKLSKYLILISSLFFSVYLSAGDVLTIGKVTLTERQKTYSALKPMVNYVADQLSDYGIEKGEVYFASNNHEMSYALLTGRVDWVTDSVFSALIMSEKTEANIELERVSAGGVDYRSLMLVKKESLIYKIADIKGKIVVFEDIGSSSAYFMPYIELVKNGMTPDLMSEDNDEILKNKNAVSYIFSGSEFGLVSDLMSGKVDAIAYSNQDYEELLLSIKDKNHT